MIQKLKRIYRFLFRKQPKFKYTIKIKCERHGNEYGGWNIIKNSLNRNSIVYSFGIGNDISFDQSIISKYQCNVFAFDPTPKVRQWVNNQQISANFLFYETGLSDLDGEIDFYEPVDKNNISHTAINLGNSSKFQVPSKKLSTIMSELKHDYIDLLKMDIEGFEYKVLINILNEKINIKQLLVEFHHFFPENGIKSTENAIKILEQNGYRLYSVSDSYCEFSFTKN